MPPHLRVPPSIASKLTSLSTHCLLTDVFLSQLLPPRHVSPSVASIHIDMLHQYAQIIEFL